MAARYQRLRDERDALADVKTADLDHLMKTVDGASKAMQAAGLGREAHKFVRSIIDALIIQKDLCGGGPGRVRPEQE